MKRLIFRITLITIASICTFGCASTSFLGDWDYTVTCTPDGNLIGLFTLSETEDGYVCHVLSSDGYADFESVRPQVELAVRALGFAVGDIDEQHEREARHQEHRDGVGDLPPECACLRHACRTVHFAALVRLTCRLARPGDSLRSRAAG